MFSTMVLMKGIRELWQNATSYAKEYYDQLNEIQVVTMKSQAEIDALSNKYRQMGTDMSVSSKEIASAATTFYRQGLGDEEVEQRLKYTTQFAKVAAVDFSQAAELITATANSMSNDIQGDIQRVVDVFVYLGDHAGTSGEEVATAMQRAAAAAGTFGVSFEWLGAYIATVSETTRQAAEVVGTSLNSIIARLHSIRTTGYNSDDDTKINDVAKALNTINVALLDQEGNWRDMTEIFNEVAAQWDTLDGKQQSYIATTIAGVRQQNTFLALMNDLSKGAEGGSRAWELYKGAMTSAGTVMEKYEIWEQSVEAANGRLQASLEGLYSTFMSGGLIVGFKNLETAFVQNLTAATKFTGGLNILIPVVLAFGVAINQLGGFMNIAQKAMNAFTAHPFILAITAAVTAIGIISAAIGDWQLSAARAYQEATENLDKSQQKLNNLSGLKTQLGEVETAVNSGKAELSEYSGLLGSIGEISPTAAAAVANMKSGAITAQEGFAILNAELETLIENEKKVSALEFGRAMSNYQVPEELKSRDTRDYSELMDMFVNNHGYNASTTSAIDRNKMLWQEISAIDMAGAIQDYYDLYKKRFSQQWQEILAEFNDDIDQAMASQEGQNLWDRLWNIILGEANVDQSKIDAEFNKQADTFLSMLDSSVTQAQKQYTKGLLYDMLAGEDGLLSVDELGNLGQVFGNAFGEILDVGFENTPFGDKFAAFAKEYLSDGIAGLLSDMQRGDITDLLGLGANPIDLQSLIDDLVDIEELKGADLYQGYIAMIQNGIAQALGSADWSELLEFSPAFEDILGGSLENLLVFKKALDSGADIDWLMNLVENSANFEEFAAGLQGVSENADGVEETAEAVDNLATATKSLGDVVKNITGNIDALKDVRDAMISGKDVGIKDLTAVLELYPELFGMMDNQAQFVQGLSDTIENETDSMVAALTNFILNSEEVMADSPFAGKITDEIVTLQQVLDTFGDDPKITQWASRLVASSLEATGQLEQLSTEALTKLMNSIFSDSNVDLMHRKVIDAMDLTNAGWENAGEGIATLFTNTIVAGTKDA